MTTTNPFDLKNYIQSGVDSKLFAGGGVGFSVNQSVTCEYSDSYIPHVIRPFSKDTLFDIASIGKSMVSLVLLKFIEQGKLSLDTPLARFVGSTGKGWDKITLFHLLTNSFKLDFNEKLYTFNPEEIEMILTSSDVAEIGGYHYHNLNTIFSGWVLENFVGENLVTIIRREVFEPAEMKNSFFFSEIPKKRWRDIPPSFNEKVGNNIFIGMPHDETAYKYAEHGQVVGCSGIFSSVEDLVKFGNYVLYGAFKDSETMLAKMTVNYHAGTERTFGLGFDNPKPNYVCPCFARQVLVSTGYTGCAMWIHTQHQKVLVLLANTTYPIPTKPRKQGDIAPISPLFDYRQKLVRELFRCKHCH